MEDRFINGQEAADEPSQQKANNTAISHVEVHDVVGIIMMGILTVLFMIFMKKSQDHYAALAERILAERG
jgi:hypothetical protein